jgi:hypothetical protein
VIGVTSRYGSSAKLKRRLANGNENEFGTAQFRTPFDLGSDLKRLASQVYTMRTAQGDASVPVEISVNLDTIHPEITRAVIVFHGKGRDVEGYFSALKRAANEAGQSPGQTLLWAPQFLREEDAEAHRLPKQFLRWHAGSWSVGEPAIGPLPLSTFDVIDAMLATLANRERFPNLATVVLMGHSGGGQLLNRYAIVGKSASKMAGIHLRFVIANPSSYFYFSDDRPQSDGSFAPIHDSTCPAFDHWRYGPVRAPAKPRARSASTAVNPTSVISRAAIHRTSSNDYG